MDVYHKVLLKVFETSGGSEVVDVDMVDLLKKEGFYSNIDGINDYLCAEGWVTNTRRQHSVRITHWGIAEAKRTITDTPDARSAISKDAVRLLSNSRELVIMLEEFVASPTKEKFAVVEKRVAELEAVAGKISKSFG